MPLLRKILIVLVIDLAVLAAAEGVLRLAGLFHPPPEPWVTEAAPSPCLAGGDDPLESIAAAAASDPDVRCRTETRAEGRLRPGELPESGRRVFVVGGSAAIGVPFAYEDSYAVQLEKALDAVHPTSVVMAGRSGENSCFALTNAVRAIGHHGADAVILMSGNNEMYRWTYRFDDSWLPFDVESVRRLLARFHLYAYGEALYRAAVRRAMRVESDDEELRVDSDRCYLPVNRIDEGFPAAKWDEIRGAYLRRYRDNLAAAARFAKDQGVPLFLATLPFNYRLPPCYALPQPAHLLEDENRAAEFVTHLDAAWDAWRAGETERAADEASMASSIDPRAPLAHHLRGLALDRLGRDREAAEAFAMARETTVGWLGSMLSINQIVRNVARDEGVPLIDLAHVFDEKSAAGGAFYNAGLVGDYCHPSREGMRLMADAFAEALLPVLSEPADR